MKKLLIIALSTCSFYSFATEIFIPSGSNGSSILQSDINLTMETSGTVNFLITGEMQLFNDRNSSALKNCLVSGFGLANHNDRIAVHINQITCGDKIYKANGFVVDKDNKADMIAVNENNTLSAKQSHIVTIVLTKGITLEK